MTPEDAAELLGLGPQYGPRASIDEIETKYTAWLRPEYMPLKEVAGLVVPCRSLGVSFAGKPVTHLSRRLHQQLMKQFLAEMGACWPNFTVLEGTKEVVLGYDGLLYKLLSELNDRERAFVATSVATAVDAYCPWAPGPPKVEFRAIGEKQSWLVDLWEDLDW